MQWKEVMKRYEAGDYLPMVARDFGISTSYIYLFARKLRNEGTPIKRTKTSNSLIKRVSDII